MGLIVDFWIIIIGLISWFSMKHKDKVLTDKINKDSEERSNRMAEFDRKYLGDNKLDSKTSNEAWELSRLVETNDARVDEQMIRIYNDAKRIYDNGKVPSWFTVPDNYFKKIISEMIMASKYGKIPWLRCNVGYSPDEVELMKWIRNNFNGVFNYQIVGFRNRKEDPHLTYAWDGSKATLMQPCSKEVRYL